MIADVDVGCRQAGTRLEDLILHGSVAIGGGRRGSSSLGVSGIEVVRHLGVKLLGSLLSGATAASTATNRLLATGGRSALDSTVGVVLNVRGRLRLNLGLGDALAERLGRRKQVRRGNDDLDLWGALAREYTNGGQVSIKKLTLTGRPSINSPLRVL